MSLLERRLRRIQRDAGPRQQALLVLRALQAGEEVTPNLRDLSESDLQEFNQDVQLFNTLNVDLAVLVCGLVQTLDRLEVQRDLLRTMLAWEVAEKQAGRDCRFLRPQVRAARAALSADIGAAWYDLLAINQAVADAQAEFNGECLLPPTRSSLIEAESRLVALTEELRVVKPTEPAPESVEHLDQYLRQRSRLITPVYLIYREASGNAGWR